MAKQILQDIVKIKKDSPAVEKVSVKKAKPEIKPVTNFREDFSDKINTKFASKYETFSSNTNNSPRYLLWVVAFVSVMFLFFAISLLFSKAEITIEPKTKDFSLNKEFTAIKGSNTNGLSYNSVVLSDDISKEIKTGVEKEYIEPARGTVLIYNAFSTAPQPLAIDTRLEGSNGKIYKTKNKLTVPGMQKDGTPGKVSVEIYATEPGEEYNSQPLDFKIFGFKGTPKYVKFYARSVGEITGGMKGLYRQVEESDKEKAIKDLTQDLSSKLFEKAKEQAPDGFVLFNDANLVSITDQKVVMSSDKSSATVNVKGTFYGFVFNEKQLTDEIIKSFIEDKEKDNVFLSNISLLRFTLANKNETLFTDANEIAFTLTGNPKVVWKIDSDKISLDLLGKNKKNLNQVLAQYPNIDSATSIIKPIWKKTFPDKEKNIKIIINNPE